MPRHSSGSDSTKGAILETDSVKIRARIIDAQSAVLKRSTELVCRAPCREHQELEDAWRFLHLLGSELSAEKLRISSKGARQQLLLGWASSRVIGNVSATKVVSKRQERVDALLPTVGNAPAHRLAERDSKSFRCCREIV